MTDFESTMMVVSSWGQILPHLSKDSISWLPLYFQQTLSPAKHQLCPVSHSALLCISRNLLLVTAATPPPVFCSYRHKLSQNLAERVKKVLSLLYWILEQESGREENPSPTPAVSQSHITKAMEPGWKGQRVVSVSASHCQVKMSYVCLGYWGQSGPL